MATPTTELTTESSEVLNILKKVGAFEWGVNPCANDGLTRVKKGKTVMANGSTYEG